MFYNVVPDFSSGGPIPKQDNGGPESIPRLLNTAIQLAKAGDEAKARSIWATAIARGYQEHPKAKKYLESWSVNGKGVTGSS